MSARAAWRLEGLGFPRVYRFEAGKAGWAAAGLPVEGEQAHTLHARDVARQDVPTCRLTEGLTAVQSRVRATGWETCVVVNDAGVVLGRLGRRLLSDDAHAGATVEEVMTAGPSTFRPDVPLLELTAYMREHELDTALITTQDGVLMGLVLRADAEQRIHESHAAAHGGD